MASVMLRARALGLGVFLLTSALLVFNTAATRAGTELATLPSPRRYWEDTGAAALSYLDHSFPRTAEPAPRAEAFVSQGTVDTRAEPWWLVRGLVKRATAQNGIPPWALWRTIPSKPFLGVRDDLVPIRPFEDPGRAWLLGMGFRLLGGISPFLLLWLGVILCVPPLGWVLWEFFEAGWAISGSAFALLVASSPFVIDTLTLPHAGVGFYLIAWLLVVALGAYGFLGRPSPRGLLVRSVVAGAGFALCALCRSGSLLLAPGFLLALVGGAVRAGRGKRLFLGALVLFASPRLLLPPTGHHNVWPTIWEGLGDFDRTKGHAWSDAEAKRTLAYAGVDPGSPESYGFWSRDCEEFLRRSVLADLRQDPSWYGGILVKRLWATLSQEKLSPWGPRDGRSMTPSSSPNEGNMDRYWRMATTVDHLGFGSHKVELPLSLLLAPTVLLLTMWLVAPLRGSIRLGPPLLTLLCAAAAALPLPVLISTASGLETEVFALVHLLGLAFVLQAVPLRFLENGPLAKSVQASGVSAG